MPRCVACNNKVEDGAVRCFHCGAVLSNPASFGIVIGWVLIGVSSIPISLGIVLEGEHTHIPLIFGVAVLLLGLVVMLAGRAKAKAAAPTVVPDEAGF
jgi:hypothetical protein